MLGKERRSHRGADRRFRADSAPPPAAGSGNARRIFPAIQGESAVAEVAALSVPPETGGIPASSATIGGPDCLC